MSQKSFDNESINLINNFKHQFNIITSPVKVLYVSSYIPRKCGIATFTKDLTNAINHINPLKLAKIAALTNDDTSGLNYPDEVILKIKDDSIEDFKKAARFINKSKSVDIVSIQHEFGIFGGDDSDIILDFVNRIKKPIVSTLHTVMAIEKDKRKETLKALADRSDYCVVMLNSSAKVLNENYHIEKDKIFSIRHGIPDVPQTSTDKIKEKLGLQGKIVMSSVNLLTQWKGIEYGIKAIPEIIKKYPNFVYLVIGETHPVWFKKFDKGNYRRMLEKMVDELGIRENVKFINEYVTLSNLVKYVQASDFYITSYLQPQQAASGALAYAIGAGKVCISTPYLYAKEMLGRDKGIKVPFRNSTAISKAIISVLENPTKRKWLEDKAYKIGRTMTWANVAHQYFHLYQRAAKN